MNLPNGVQPGRDTLVIAGTLPDGNRVTYYDFVTVDRQTDSGAVQSKTNKDSSRDGLETRSRAAVITKGGYRGAVYFYGSIVVLIIMVIGGLLYAFQNYLRKR